MRLKVAAGWLLTLAVIAVLTLLTQIGGLIWLLSLLISRLWTRRFGLAGFLLLFATLYAAGAALSHAVAPVFGRVPLPCFDDGSSRLRMQSTLYCVLNRHYVVPELQEAAAALSRHMNEAFPGTTTLARDANFPFVDGFPLLPHLSHADGRKLDVVFYYQDAEGRFLDKATRSPVGYFAFEQPREDSVLPCKGLTTS